MGIARMQIYASLGDIYDTARSNIGREYCRGLLILYIPNIVYCPMRPLGTTTFGTTMRQYAGPLWDFHYTVVHRPLLSGQDLHEEIGKIFL